MVSIEIEDEVVKSFTDALQEKISHNLKRVVLFGSRARKDHNKHSDYEFMVLLKQKNEENIELVFDVGYSILDKYNALVSCLIWDEEDYIFHKQLQIGKNIEKDGVLLF